VPYKNKEVAKQKRHKYYVKHRDIILSQCKEYAKTHKKPRHREVYNKNFYRTHKKYFEEYYLEHKTEHDLYSKAYTFLIRKKVLNHYGHRCACCGERRYEFLSIDHINGGGNKHRKEIGNGKIYLWLIKNSYPEGFQVLCCNCNQAKGHYGYCPHEKDLQGE
jgi:predicted restriction endonuclease